MLVLEDIALRVGGFSLVLEELSVAEAGYTALLGPSGAGKSLVLDLIAGLLRPARGRVRLQGVDLTRLPPRRRPLGYVPQSLALFPHRSVAGNIAYPLEAAGVPRAERRARVQALAARVGAAHLLDHRPHTLSGGEAQRVALARALAREPALLLLDEPLSALDVGARQGLREVLRQVRAAGTAVLHVTHDPEEAAALAREVAVLDQGRLVQAGPLREVMAHPRTPFMARFVGVRNVLQGTLGPPGPLRRLSTGPLSFQVLSEAPPGPATLLVDASSVVLCRQHTPTSERNVFAGTVTDLRPLGPGFEVGVDAGERLVALVTAEALAELGLAPGVEVLLSIKAASCRVLPG